MTITFLAPDGAPITAQQFRQANAALYGGGSGKQLGGRSGFRVGTAADALVATSTTWTLKPCSAMIDPGAATYQGMYGWASDATISGAVTASDATYARKDIVYIQVNDSSSGDASGEVTANVKYLAGDPLPTPVAKALPARSFLVGTIDVPKTGAGSPTVVLNPTRFVAAGAPLPVTSKTERDALAKYDGAQVLRLDVEGRLQTCFANVWGGGERAEFTGKLGQPPGSLYGTGPLTRDTAQSRLDELILTPAADTIAFPFGEWDVHWRARMTNGAATPVMVPVTAPTWMQITDGSGNEITSFDLAMGRSTGQLDISTVYFPSGGSLKFRFYTETAGVTLESRVRITRH